MKRFECDRLYKLEETDVGGQTTSPLQEREATSMKSKQQSWLKKTYEMTTPVGMPKWVGKSHKVPPLEELHGVFINM